jgi:tetratricopeptide (TPR) repeat protein
MTDPRITAILSPHDIGELVALVNQERPREAESKARVLLKAFPQVGMLWKILGVAMLRQGKDALQVLQRTADLLPQDAEAQGNLAAVLMERGQSAEALVSWQRALAIQPRDVDALTGAADALRTLGRAREALECYQRALAENPGSVEARNNLGNAYLELRRFDDAVACYRRVLKIKPDDAQLNYNLSNALWQQGALEEALSSGRRAIELDPGLAVAHCILGHVLRDLGHRRDAATLYAKAVELDPLRAEYHCNLGNALFELRRAAAAVECQRRALELLPDHVPALLCLSAALRLLRRADEAEASCRAALRSEPRNVEALVFLGELLADRGRFAEAEELFKRALDIDPAYPSAYCSIAMHRKMTAADAGWLQGAAALLERRLPLRNEISVRYALGKYCDDVGRYAEAFDHYRKANELTKRYASGYDREKLKRRVDRVIGCFDAAFVERAARHASATELPVFVVGMPRSGTSLVEQILASHPAVIGAGELNFWDVAFRNFKDADRLHDEQLDELLTTGVSGVAGSYLGLLPTFAAPVLRVVDKMPANFLYAGLIHAIFPQARIIHMRRHPLDTCLSIYFQNFFGMSAYANDLDDLAHYYGEYLRITDHWRRLLPATALLEVPYEGLIADQEGWTRRMVEFLGLPWDPNCLEFQQTERVVITASKWQVRQKIHAASAGRWRHYAAWLGPLEQALTRAGVPV